MRSALQSLSLAQPTSFGGGADGAEQPGPQEMTLSSARIAGRMGGR
jgi:hypothetical protein